MGLSLGNIVGGLSAAGGGYIQGVRQAKQDQFADEEMGMRRQEMGLRQMTLERQAKDDQRKSEEMDLERQAQEEAGRVFKDRVKAGQEKAKQGLGGVMAPGSEAEYQPSKDDMLEAGDAYAKFWLKSGKVDRYIAADGKNEAMRMQMRKAAVEKHMGTWQQDPAPLLKELNRYSANDVEDVTASPRKDKDGQTVYDITMTHKGGKTSKITSTQDDIAQQIERQIDPAGSFKSWRQIRMEEIKAANLEKRDEAKDTRRVEREKTLEAEKHKNNLREIGARNYGGLSEVRERGKQDRLTLAEKEGGGLDSGTGEIKTLTEANKQYREARLELDNAKNRAIQVRIKDNTSLYGASPEERDNLVDKHPDVVEARRKLAEVDRMRQGLMNKRTGGGLSDALPAGLPAGSKQIGTENGKPVYQTPDGKKLVQN